jgi:hypothetical protein
MSLKILFFLYTILLFKCQSGICQNIIGTWIEFEVVTTEKFKNVDSLFKVSSSIIDSTSWKYKYRKDNYYIENSIIFCDNSNHQIVGKWEIKCKKLRLIENTVCSSPIGNSIDLDVRWINNNAWYILGKDNMMLEGVLSEVYVYYFYLKISDDAD